MQFNVLPSSTLETSEFRLASKMQLNCLRNAFKCRIIVHRDLWKGVGFLRRFLEALQSHPSNLRQVRAGRNHRPKTSCGCVLNSLVSDSILARLLEFHVVDLRFHRDSGAAIVAVGHITANFPYKFRATQCSFPGCLVTKPFASIQIVEARKTCAESDVSYKPNTSQRERSF